MSSDNKSWNWPGITSRAVIILIFLLCPCFAIWAVNTLFNTGIILTFKTWLAAMTLMAIYKILIYKPGLREDDYDYDEDFPDFFDDYDDIWEDDFDIEEKKILKKGKQKKDGKAQIIRYPDRKKGFPFDENK